MELLLIQAFTALLTAKVLELLPHEATCTVKLIKIDV